MWVRSYGGPASASGWAIALNPISKDCFTIGRFKTFLPVGPFNLTGTGNPIHDFNDQLFVIASNANGDPIYARGYIAPTRDITPGGVAVDLGGNAYVGAAFSKTVMIGPEVGNLTNVGDNFDLDIMLLKLKGQPIAGAMEVMDGRSGFQKILMLLLCRLQFTNVICTRTRTGARPEGHSRHRGQHRGYSRQCPQPEE